MDTKEILSPLMQGGFAVAFGITFIALVYFVRLAVTRLLDVVDQNTRANRELAGVIADLQKSNAVGNDLLIRIKDDLYRRPCLKDRA